MRRPAQFSASRRGRGATSSSDLLLGSPSNMRRRTLGLLGASIVVGSGLWLACGGSDGARSAHAARHRSRNVLPGERYGRHEHLRQRRRERNASTGTGQQEAGGGDGGINPPDAGPGGTTTVINCGSTSCAIPAQTCCVDRLGGQHDRVRLRHDVPRPRRRRRRRRRHDRPQVQRPGQLRGRHGVLRPPGGQQRRGLRVQGHVHRQRSPALRPRRGRTGCTGTTCSNNNIGDWNLPQTYATCGGKGN